MSAYVVIMRDRTLNEDELALYQEMAPAARVGRDFTPLAFYGKLEILEGKALEGAVILRFSDMAAAKEWYFSPEYQEALPHRKKGAESRVFLIEGTDAG